jgi:hypothetical protein
VIDPGAARMDRMLAPARWLRLDRTVCSVPVWLLCSALAPVACGSSRHGASTATGGAGSGGRSSDASAGATAGRGGSGGAVDSGVGAGGSGGNPLDPPDTGAPGRCSGHSVLAEVTAGGAGGRDAGASDASTADAAVNTVYAFPGAEGFGRNARGGRGGGVCHVTNLAPSGPGSFLDCVSLPNYTVVFDVSGWITLTGDIGVGQSRLTIAGQTAPSLGIGIRGRTLNVGGSDVVMRFLRVRRGTVSTIARNDAMIVASAAHDLIIDHCSIAFGTDETLSVPGDTPTGPHNLTVQWSIIAWGLQKDNHSAGSLFVSNMTTIHHTLWAFNKTRNPRCRSESPTARGQGGHVDWVNNVTFGWNASDPVGAANGWTITSHPFILGGTTTGEHSANAIGNYFVSELAASYAFVEGTPNFSLYFENNLLDGNGNGQLDVSDDTLGMIEGTPTLLTARLPSADVTIDDPATAYERVLASAGTTVPARDETDELLISRVQSQTGDLLQTEADLAAVGIGDRGYGTLPIERRPVDYDTDCDGMPDTWETAHALDPADPADRNEDRDADGYTNLEEYLDTLAGTY